MMDFKLFGNGRITLPRLVAATMASLISLLLSFLLGTPECSRPANCQNFSFYRVGHTCCWSIKRKHL